VFGVGQCVGISKGKLSGQSIDVKFKTGDIENLGGETEERGLDLENGRHPAEAGRYKLALGN
jgi:hypothetical protein